MWAAKVVNFCIFYNIYNKFPPKAKRLPHSQSLSLQREELIILRLLMATHSMECTLCESPSLAVWAHKLVLCPYNGPWAHLWVLSLLLSHFPWTRPPQYVQGCACGLVYGKEKRIWEKVSLGSKRMKCRPIPWTFLRPALFHSLNPDKELINFLFSFHFVDPRRFIYSCCVVHSEMKKENCVRRLDASLTHKFLHFYFL